MRQMMLPFAISAAVAFFAIGLRVIDGFQIAATAGSTDAIGQFIILGVIAVLAVVLLTTASPR